MKTQPSRLCYYHPELITPSSEHLRVDVCVYGGNSAGVIAAVQAVSMGKSVAVLEPGDHLGGLTAGGLGWTDFGNKSAIGGRSLQFYRQMGRHYGVEAEWCFEPHIAEQTYQALLAQAQVTPRFRQYLQSVEMHGSTIASITLEGGLRVSAKMFIDATYEGDLMARAGVPYTVGRESNAQYNETLNGVQVGPYHQFDCAVDPYRVEGDRSSGLLPTVNATLEAPNGSADKRVQAYCFRMCMTSKADNRIPFPKPAGYDPAYYLLVARWLRNTKDNIFRKFDPIRGDKTDTNNHGAVSTDFIGANYDWPDGDYATREKIFQAHVTYQQGLHWFMANDAQVPDAFRSRYSQYGLPRDEYPQTGGWTHQLYIREARRMVSDVVITQHVCQGREKFDDSVGMGSYGMDSHNCQRFVDEHGHVRNEGDVQVKLPGPYPISYRSIVPPRGSCANLFVPVCLSATHIAYGSARMEPVFMILGQSAATAACQALDRDCTVHDLPYGPLRDRLVAEHQVLLPAAQ